MNKLNFANLLLQIFKMIKGGKSIHCCNTGTIKLSIIFVFICVIALILSYTCIIIYMIYRNSHFKGERVRKLAYKLTCKKYKNKLKKLRKSNKSK